VARQILKTMESPFIRFKVNVFILTEQHPVIIISHFIDHEVSTKVAPHTDPNDLFDYNKNLDSLYHKGLKQKRLFEWEKLSPE
jgi:hypothetical protein